MSFILFIYHIIKYTESHMLCVAQFLLLDRSIPLWSDGHPMCLEKGEKSSGEREGG